MTALSSYFRKTPKPHVTSKTAYIFGGGTVVIGSALLSSNSHTIEFAL